MLSNKMNNLSSFIELKKNFLKKENIYFFALVLIIFFSDRISKIKILNEFNENTFYVNKYINLDLIWNTGIGFGFFSSTSPVFYNTVTGLIGIVILYLIGLFLVSDYFDKLIFSIIIGGACGNFYDRIIYKAVPDFIDLHYNTFHWFTFNIADVFITIGILIYLFRGSLKK